MEIIVVQFCEGIELLHGGLAPALQKLVHRHWFLAIDLSNEGSKVKLWTLLDTRYYRVFPGNLQKQN